MSSTPSSTVYDLGCQAWGTETSIPWLVDRFRPERLLGFDPQATPESFWLGETHVVVDRRAAWTHSDGVALAERGGSRCFVTDTGTVPSVDIAALILREPEPVVVKMDIEGGEYVLVPHLQRTGALGNVSLLLVEWHGDPLTGVEWEPWHDG